MGIFVPYSNEPGAFWGLIVGLIIGLFRMINEFALPGPRCGDADPRPLFILRVHYLYFAILLAGITFIIVTIISFLTPSLDKKYQIRLTWWTRYNTAERADYEIISHQVFYYW